MKAAKAFGLAIGLFLLAAPAYSDTLTVDITGTGSGTALTSFSGQTIDLHFVGPAGGGNVVDLTTATVSIGGGAPIAFTSPMQIGLDSSNFSAFFGYQGGSNVFVAFFSQTDFGNLQNSNFFDGDPLSVDISAFLDVPITGGTLSFDSFTGAHLHVVVTGIDTPLPPALPLFASGLGALGLLGWRRKKKAAPAAA